jgi:hypothetical protein
MDLTVNFGVAEAGKLDCSSSIVVFHSYYKVKMQITYKYFPFKIKICRAVKWECKRVEPKIDLILHNYYI